MVLTTTPRTKKENIEFRLLIAIRFACLLSQHKDPMSCPRVNNRLAKLERYLQYTQPSQLFIKTYCIRAGELGQSFSLRVDEATSSIRLYRNTETNVAKLITV
ncbi:hypothetical protein [Shewanella sp. MBTL60-007]|uniref:hypothetical protein n=1 Tax=Shewanella sp. MBTL60-007 TaxID=2815911 RepID=UPI001BBE4E94|nr:hypothetical protein [Shewanella sp. MBTL60-007]GIU22123.1 hypothetical protein TUM3792_23820 [Shewanella sp. MBTL60-007]